jgi:hypothetical protein
LNADTQPIRVVTIDDRLDAAQEIALGDPSAE